MAGQLNSVYLLTEWEGWTAKCLVRAHEIQTEDNKVCTFEPRLNWTPLSPDTIKNILVMFMITFKVLKI